MCGRMCLTLSAEDIKCQCAYVSGKSPAESKREIVPEWRPEYNLGNNYAPSYNLTPTRISPVIVSAAHFEGDAVDANDRVIVPMVWGIIPYWHQGNYKKHGLTTNNCRLENLLNSKLYRSSFERGQRCVILCEGYYEWQTTKTEVTSQRAVYYFHDRCKSEPTQCSSSLVKLAGIFDIWLSESGDQVYSYTVITLESNNFMAWLHHRMPAVLDTDDEVTRWLNFRTYDSKEALKVLHGSEQMAWYEVSNYVNFVKNDSIKCKTPIEEIRIKSENQSMKSWLAAASQSKK